MLIVEPKLNLDKINKEWDEFVNKAGDGIDKITGASNKASPAVAGIGKNAGTSSDAVEKMAKSFNADKAISSIGALKNGLEKIGGPLLGISESANKAIGNVADLAVQGGQLGLAFGPIGGAVGAGVGAVLGIISENSKSAEKELSDLSDTSYRVAESQRQVADQIKAVNKELGKINTSTLEGALTAFDAVQSDIDAAIKERDATSREKLKLDIKASTEYGEDLSQLNEAEQKKLKELNAKYNEKTELIKKLGDIQKKNAEDTKAAGIDEANAAIYGTERSKKQLDFEKGATQFDIQASKDRIKALKDELKLATSVDEKKRIGSTIKEESESIKKNEKLLKDNTTALKGLSTGHKELKPVIDKTTESVDAYSEAMEIANGWSDKPVRELDIQPISPFSIDGFDPGDPFGIDSISKLPKSKAPEVADTLDATAQSLKDLTGVGNGTADAMEYVGATIANSLGVVAVKGINDMFDAFANGERKSKADRARARAEFMRATGTQLMTDGISHVLMGATKAIVPLTRAQGIAEAEGGAIEVAAGAAMGGVGAIGQRRLGGTQAHVDQLANKSSSIGGSSGNSGNSGNGTNSTIVVNFPQSTLPMSNRELQEHGLRLKKILES